jgi:phosphoglycerate dehydrogenase-like enzyme
MRPSAILINTSRGFVVDNLALKEFYAANRDALAMLDVHEPEPFAADYPLLGLPNVKLFPHLASRTETAMNNMSWVVRDVVAVLEGRTPEFPAPAI